MKTRVLANGRKVPTLLAAVFLAGAFTSFQVRADVSLADSFNFDGVLTDSTGTPINVSSQIDFQIYDPAGVCLLYEETQTVAPDAQGNFSLLVGTGARAATDPGLAWTTIFQNNSQVRSVGSGCTGGYIPAAGDGRKLRVSVGSTTLTPDFDLSSVPMANVAQTLQGLDSTKFIQTATPNLTQANVENVFSSTNYPILLNLLTAGPNVVAVSPGGGISLPVLAAPPVAPTAGQLWYDSTTAQMNYYNGTSVQQVANGSSSASGVTSIVAGVGLLGGTITSTGSLSVDVGTTANKIVQLNASGQLPAVDGSLLTNISGIHALTGDVTATGSGSVATTIMPNAVTSAKINNTGIAVNRLLMTDAVTGSTVTYANCSLNQVMQYTATGWVCTSIPSALGASGAIAGTYGNPMTTAVITVDATGRATSVTSTPIAFPVTSVAGRTGAVTLSAADIGGLGTASLQNYGAAANELVQLDSSARLPAVDGSQLINANAASLQGQAVSATAPVAGQVLAYNGVTSSWQASANLTVSSAYLKSATAMPSALNIDTTDISGAGAISRLNLDVAGNPAWSWATDSSQYLKIENSTGTVQMSMTQNGNLGIGTMAPAVSLDLSSRTDAVALPVGTSATRPVAPAPGMLRFNTTGVLEFYNGSVWTSLSNGGVGTYLSASGGSMTGDLLGASGTPAAPGYAFNGDSSTGLFDAGVGTIGISSSGTEVFKIGPTFLSSTVAGGAVVNSVNGTAATPTFSFVGDPGTGWFRPAPAMLAASTGGTERLRIDNNGNVGIGTQAPNAILNVVTTGTNPAQIDAAADGVNPGLNIHDGSPGQGQMGYINFYTGSGTPSLAAQIGYTSNNYFSGGFQPNTMSFDSFGSPMYFSTGFGAPVPSLYISPMGNVGVGTTAPTNPFTVSVTSTANSGTASGSVGSVAYAPATTPSAGTMISGTSSFVQSSSAQNMVNANLIGELANATLNTGAGPVANLVGVAANVTNISSNQSLGGSTNALQANLNNMANSNYNQVIMVGGQNATGASASSFNGIEINVQNNGTISNMAAAIYIDPWVGSGTYASGMHYGIYQSDASSPNVFMGRVAMGAGTPPNAPLSVGGTLASSTGVDLGIEVAPNVIGSGTEGYTALDVNVTQTSTGSGPKLLENLRVSGTSKFSIDSTGNVITTGSIAPATTGQIVNYAVSPALMPMGTISGTQTFNFMQGNTVQVTINGNLTISAFNTIQPGQMLFVVICQDATGGHTLTWPTMVHGGMTISTTPSTCNAQSFVVTTTAIYALSSGATGI